jgi:tripartite-type tricarboxylate transporter receptor subunit TctC
MQPPLDWKFFCDRRYFVRTILVLLIAFIALANGKQSTAEEWPARPVKIVVAFPAGGTPDAIARELAQKLTESFGQSFYVEIRSGASGNLGTAYVAKSAPDGYTLLVGVDVNIVIAPNWDSNLPYKASDFAPVSLIAHAGFVLAAHPSLGVNNVGELIALARKRPGEINYGSAGPGSNHELFIELLQRLGAFKLTEVPYRGSSEAVPDLLSGQIQVLFVGAAGFPYFHSGQLKALGVGALERFESLPDIPTIAEQGFPGFEADNPIGLYAPASTPQNIIIKLQQQMVHVLTTKDIHERFAAMGAIPTSSTPEALAAHITKESEKWARVIHDMRTKESR